uniref:Growth-regulating factor n=1 Tax=Anthurium amnicola TaxID=1678845 RepID=A0A1D1XFA3_9ARAE
MNKHWVLAGVRGPFTPSQWLELEHQALIYKYIDANVPVPASLLIPIRKSLNASGFPAYSAGSLRTSALGWSPFHLGFSGNADPEPGRCRRTDGKKWRCSRDAVADQKYCERHMNRGRHRSRKPVEGHSGHAAKAMSIIAPTATAVPGGGSSNTLGIAQQQMKSLQPDSTDPSRTQFSRIMINKENLNDGLRSPHGLSMPTSVNQKPKDTLFPMPKQHNPFEASSSRADFGLISSDSLLNPPPRSSSYLESRAFAPASTELNNAEPQPNINPLRHFFDDWPKGRSSRLTISWPDVEEIQTDRTQLSISIPMASSDFSSSSSSPAQEKVTLSPFKLTRETDPIHMGLGVGGILNEMCQREASWVPISWEPSMGGPLGEALNKTSNPPTDHSKNTSSSSLNLMTEGWDSSPRLGSSPTGVLQKTTFASLSGSTGSSPRAETHRTHDSTSSMCDDLLGSTLVNSSSIPTL